MPSYNPFSNAFFSRPNNNELNHSSDSLSVHTNRPHMSSILKDIIKVSLFLENQYLLLAYDFLLFNTLLSKSIFNISYYYYNRNILKNKKFERSIENLFPPRKRRTLIFFSKLKCIRLMWSNFVPFFRSKSPCYAR